MSGNRKKRCAIYTRTSSDEHLDQEFNSLHAQREACEAFIRSQSGEGWQLLSDGYEDGGFSGGTMDRPALQQLLVKIRDKRIDVVVVYKIDRLTRSLMDFARIVEIFDANDVSFVSVTQAFNTTTSMGRLTLNVLLSFAQFEREVTAERIRDKIAASKRRGIWMGGHVPLGYRVENRKLCVEESEAETIRFIFRRYLKLQSIRKLAEELNRADLTIRRSKPRSGRDYITAPFRAGNLRNILANPVYVGKIRHKEKLYEGEHDGIIDPGLFEQAQVQLKQRAPRRRHSGNVADIHLLTGILFDESGNRLTPSHARNHGKHYRYYVSRRLMEVTAKQDSEFAGWRIRAEAIETIVENQLLEILGNGSQLHAWFAAHVKDKQVQQLISRATTVRETWKATTPDVRRVHLKQVFRRITLRTGWIRFEFDRKGLLDWLLDQTTDPKLLESETTATIEYPLAIRRRGVEKRLILANGPSPGPSPDPTLMELVVRANQCLRGLTDGTSKRIAHLATEMEVDRSDLSRLLRLAFLSPRLVESILEGTQPPDLGVRRLARLADLPLDWSQQAEILGF